jgi:hypothetical protein
MSGVRRARRKLRCTSPTMLSQSRACGIQTSSARGLGDSLGDGKTDIEATIAELVAAFPATFTLEPSQVRPLKLGIRDELFTQSAISHRRITAALRAYCNSVHYLKANTEGAVRLDLAGESAGIVTSVEAEFASGRLTKLAKTVDKPSGKAPNGDCPGPAHVPTGPKRLSLGDLKRAAAARRASR